MAKDKNEMILDNYDLEWDAGGFISMAAGGISSIIASLATVAGGPLAGCAVIGVSKIAEAIIGGISITKKDKSKLNVYEENFYSVVGECVNKYFADKVDRDKVFDTLAGITMDKLDIYTEDLTKSSKVICELLNSNGVEIDEPLTLKFLNDIVARMLQRIDKNAELRSYVTYHLTVAKYKQNGESTDNYEFQTEMNTINTSLKDVLDSNDALNKIALENNNYLKDIIECYQSLKDELNKKIDLAEERLSGKIENLNETIPKKTADIIEKRKKDSSINTSKDDYLKKWNEVLFLHKGIDETKTLGETYIEHEYTHYDKETGKFEKAKDIDEETEEIISFEKFIMSEIESEKTGNVLVTGAPGIGKSSLASYIAVECQKKNIENLIIINFGELNDSFREDFDKPKRSLCSAISEYLGFESEIKFKNFILKKECITTIILDAFDEFIAAKKEVELLKKWCEEINSWNAKYEEKILLIVTSRDNYVREDAGRLVEGFIDKELNEGAERNINFDRKKDYAEHGEKDIIKDNFSDWYKLEEFSDKKIDDYHYKITGEHIPVGSIIPEKNREVVGIPVILYMCLSLPNPIKITEGTSRYEIYKKIFNIESGIFDKFAKIVGENKGYSRNYVDKHIKLPMYYLLQMLAYKIFDNNEKPILKDTYTDVLAINVRTEKGEKLTFDNTSRGIMDYPIKNLYEGSNRIDFVHKTIREYFMSLRVFNNIKAVFDVDYEIKYDTSDMQYIQKENEFVKSFGSLLKKCALIRGNETAVYEFLMEMLKEHINSSDKSECFIENLSNMSFWAATFGKMFETGLSYYTIDETSEDFYVENTGRSFGVVSTQEQTCFKNMVDLIQMIRELTGKTDDIFKSEWSSRKENTDKSSNEVIIPDEQYYKFYMAEYLRDCHYDRLNLSGFDLSNCNLSDADMSGYDLRKTNMKSSNLTNCNLEFADLRGATVTDCNLTGAHLAGIRGNIKAIRANNTISWSTDFAGVNIRKGIEKELVVGNLYEFGSYPQYTDEKGKYKPEPILWRVLDIVDGNALLLSEKILDCIPYNEKYESITWDKCTLNKRLNNEFYNTAFGEIKNAGSMIVKPQNINPKYIASKNEKGQDESGNVEITIAGKKDNCDRIFLLSKEELLMYYDRRKDEKEKVSEDDWWLRIGGAQAVAYGTEYAENRGLSVNDAGIGRWWLRSGGSGGSHFAMRVNFDGGVYTIGNNVYTGYVGVRPALWINLKS